MDIEARTHRVSDEQLRVRVLVALHLYHGAPEGAFEAVRLEAEGLGVPDEDDARGAFRYWADQDCVKRSVDGWEITERGRVRALRLLGGNRTRDMLSLSMLV